MATRHRLSLPNRTELETWVNHNMSPRITWEKMKGRVMDKQRERIEFSGQKQGKSADY